MITLALWLMSAQPLVGVMPPLVDESAAPAGDMERAIGGAVAEVASVRRASPEAMARLLQSAAKSGIACDVRRAECAGRVGAFGSLDFVIVAHVSAEPLRAEMSLIDCADGRAVRTVASPLAADAAALRADLERLTREVLGVASAAAPIVRAPESAPPSTPREPLAPSSSTPPSTGAGMLGRVGVGTLAVGALVAAGAGVGAWVVAPTDDTRAHTSARAYNDAVGVGRALLGVSAGGLALAALGAAAWLADGPGDVP